MRKSFCYGWDVKKETWIFFPTEMVQTLSAGVDALPLGKLAEKGVI